MAQQFPELNAQHQAFIAKQKIFFTASAARDGRINLSPKGLGGLRILGPRQVAYLDLTGSGNETAAHLRADGRLTLMLCAFEGPPLILRLYGRGASAFHGSERYEALLAAHFGGETPPGARQIVTLDIEMVQTSCGYGVPHYSYESERPALLNWAQSKGEDGIRAYWREKNARSIDGLPTGAPD